MTPTASSDVRATGDRQAVLSAAGTPDPNPIAEFFRYHGVWAPGVRLFRAIGFRAKALVISAVFGVPILLLALNYFQAQQANIDFSAKERLGLQYARAALPLLDVWLQAPADTARANALLAELAKAEAALGADLGTGPAHAALLAALKPGQAQPIVPLLDLLGVATDGSNLTLDPDIDTYYLMDAALFRLPVMAYAAAQIRDAEPAAQRVVIEQAILLSTHAAATRAGLAKATAYNAEVGPAARVAEVDAPLQALLTQAEARLLAADAARPDAQPALAAMSAFSTRVIDALDALIAQRVARLEFARNVTAAVTLAGLLLAVYLFAAFRKVLDGGLREVAFHIEAMRDGDLTTQPRAWGADEAASLMATLAAMQASLRGIVGQVRGASDSIVHAAREISGASSDLSGRTDASASNLQQTASGMEQIAATVQHNEATVSEAARLAEGNAHAAERGGQVIGDVVSTMQAIRASSGRIGDIIGTIDGIAFQTNILALNAAVEAARAGEQGRGFAVVAAEVRALAQRSAVSAREIKSLINSSLSQVENGTRVVRQAGDSIDEIVGSSRRVRELLSEVAHGAREQTVGIAESSKAVQNLDTMTQQNAALVEQTAAAAASLDDQARGLAAMVARFRLQAA
jgi:methyl-accepting chemotaxis protein